MSAEAHDLIRAELRRQADRYILEDRLKAAVTHLLGLGKLYRPRLALATFEAITGGGANEHIPAVCALEHIHTFTLIHDDLPCMDDASLRRGVPAVHIAFDEALAVLAGDALCDMAFQVLADGASGLDPSTALKLVASLAYATQAVVAGQVIDLAAEGQQLDAGAVRDLHRKKTGALLAACCEFGAILAGAEDLRPALHEVGLMLGELFQLRDDLLSHAGDESAVGKSLGSDAALEKSTIVSALGRQGSEAHAQDLLQDVRASIDRLSLRHPGPLLAMAHEALARSS